MPLRLFVAVPLPDRLREGLAAYGRALPAPGVRWLPADNLHVTVRFIGDTPERDLPDLIARLREACATHPRFVLRVDGVRPRPRMVWATIEPSERYARLAHDLGGDGDRPPRPHITIARCRRRPPPLPPPALGDPRVPVDTCELMSSRLGRSGAVYSLVARLPLMDEAGPPGT